MVEDDTLEYIIKRVRAIPMWRSCVWAPVRPLCAPAYHSRAVRHAEEVSPRVAEHPLQHPQGVHSRSRQGLRYAG